MLGFTAWQATQVRSELDVVATQLSESADRLADGDVESATRAASAAGDAADAAHRHSSGPVWALGSRLPWLGDDVTAVRVVAEVADSLTAQTLPDLLVAAESFGPQSLEPRNSRIALKPIVEAAPALTSGAEQMAAAQERVQRLETDGLLDAVAAPVADLQDKLGRAADLAGTAATAAYLLPPMLGAEEDRHYLMVFQTNAEVRALGGMAGAHALVRARDGRMEIVSQGRPAQLGTFPEDFIELSEAELDLFTTRMSVFPQNSTMVPDFPRTAQILTRMWEERRPERLDGVLSADPVTLGYLLEATGPVTLGNGQRLTSDNAADYLLNGVYTQVPDLTEQNLVFEEAARLVFGALMDGGLDPKRMVEALARSAEERRLMLWSARDDEQQRLDGTPLAGALPVAESDTPEVGVYLNDSAADKLSYYLDYAVDVTPRSCGSTDAQVIDVEVTLTNTLPPGSPIVPSILGPGLDGAEPGTLRKSLLAYGPVSGSITSALLDGSDAPITEVTHLGRPVGVVTFDLAPGQTRSLSYEMRTPAGQSGDPRLVTTPLSTTVGAGEVGPSAC